MRVRVTYTVDITDGERLDLAAHFNEWPDRDAIKQYLHDEGVMGLEVLSGEGKWLTRERMQAIGVPRRLWGRARDAGGTP